MGLTLAEALRLPPKGSGRAQPRQFTAVAFVGAGGKTTAMFQLAGELSPPVITTASTHLAIDQTGFADRHVVATEARDIQDITLVGTTLVTGPASEDGRTEAAGDAVLRRLHAYARDHNVALLIEADGSRQKSLKAPAGHEPPIPDFASIVVVVAGLGALGKPLSRELVHRSEVFSRLSGMELGAPISASDLVRVLTHDQGGLKNIPPEARRVVLLNQADTPSLQAIARESVPALLTKFDSVITASVQDRAVHAVHERVAGVILAAGESKRFGKPKQLLPWQGSTFVRAVTATALAAGLSPVILVTGADSDAVEAAVGGLPIQITCNEDWRRGQASSVRKGLAAVPRDAGAAVFMLADQPQIPRDAVTGLVEAHAASLNPIVAPIVQDSQRGNPVLFDRATFEAFGNLQGDEGGRALFREFPVEYMPWNDERLLLDVDTEADYQRLKESYES